MLRLRFSGHSPDDPGVNASTLLGYSEAIRRWYRDWRNLSCARC